MSTIPNSKISLVINALRDYLAKILSYDTLALGVPLTSSVVAAEGTSAVFRPPMVVISPVAGNPYSDNQSLWAIDFMAQIIISMSSDDYSPTVLFDAHQEFMSVIQDYERSIDYDSPLAKLVRSVSLGRFTVRPQEITTDLGVDFWYTVEQIFTLFIYIPTIRTRV